MTAVADAPRTVVAADDDPDILGLVAIAVRKAGLSLLSQHGDGSSAWEAIAASRPDVTLLDVSMPGMTGLEICRSIRADERLADAWVLLISAGVDVVSEQAGRDAGADDFLAKPFSPRVLAERLASLPARAGAAT